MTYGNTAFNELEKRPLEEKFNLLEARTEAMESAKRIEALYTDAISAMTSYQRPRQRGAYVLLEKGE